MCVCMPVYLCGGQRSTSDTCFSEYCPSFLSLPNLVSKNPCNSHNEEPFGPQGIILICFWSLCHHDDINNWARQDVALSLAASWESRWFPNYSSLVTDTSKKCLLSTMSLLRTPKGAMFPHPGGLPSETKDASLPQATLCVCWDFLLTALPQPYMATCPTQICSLILLSCR